MYDSIAQELINSDDTYSRQWFVWQMESRSQDLNQFFIDELLHEVDHKVLALAINQDLSYKKAETSFNNYNWHIFEEGTELEQAINNVINSRVEDAFWSVPKELKRYIDTESYEEEIRSWSNEELLSSDNTEYEQVIDKITYYLYRQ